MRMEPYLVVASIWTTSGLTMAAFAALHDPRSRAAWTWCAADLVAALGIVSFLARPVLPYWLSVLVTNVLVIAQPMLHFGAIRALDGRPVIYPPWFAVVVAATAVNVMDALTRDDIAGRVVLIGLAAAAVAIPSAVTVLTQERRRLSAPKVLLAVALLLIGILHLTRALLITLRPDMVGAPTGELHGPYYATVGLVSIVANMAFIWQIVAEKAERHVAETRALMAEQDRLLRELDAARAKAEAANRAKSDFIANMSHDLRTPLNAILGFNEMIATAPGGVLSPKQAEWSQCIDRGGRQLLGLVNDILDIASVEAGHVDHAVQDVAVEPLVREVVGDLSPLADAARVSIVVRVAPGTAVAADRNRVRQVLTNLLSNAVKYNVPGGSTVVEAEAGGGGRVRIAVSDDGPGIPPERRSLLFQPFNRLGAETAKTEGTGLGLYLVRKLSEMMGGHAGFEPRETGGSRFWVELPAATGSRPG